MIKALVMDIDGVFTDGKFYGETGRTISKKFCDIDFTAIKKMKSVGIKVAFLSGDPWNAAIAINRKVDFFESRDENGCLQKGEVMKSISEKYGLDLVDMAYVGDDSFDIPTFTLAGSVFCPSNASKDVLNFLTNAQEDKYAYVCLRRGGEGVIDEIYHHCVDVGAMPRYNLEDLIRIDSEERT